MDKMINSNEELRSILNKMNGRIVILPATGEKLTRKSSGTAGGTNADTTFDHYYVEMINDTLDAIRGGEVAYIFNARQIADILSFEPTAQFEYEDGAVAVKLAA